MQIIRELEAGPRGIYGGAIGYVAKTGDLDFAIAIRTAVCKDDTFDVTAGAGHRRGQRSCEGSRRDAEQGAERPLRDRNGRPVGRTGCERRITGRRGGEEP